MEIRDDKGLVLYDSKDDGAANDLDSIDLSSHDLRSAVLEGVDLSGSNLRSADLRQSDLYWGTSKNIPLWWDDRRSSSQ